TSFWQEIIRSFGGPAALLLVLAYLIKALMRLWLDRDAKSFETKLQLTTQQHIETFKAKLQSDAAFELERLRNAVQVDALEHQIRFSKLHEQRMALITQLSKEVQEVPSVVAGYVIHNIRDAQSRKEARDRAFAFCNLIEMNRYLLPESVLIPLMYLAGSLRHIVISLSVYWTDFPDTTFARPEHRQDQQKEMMKALNFLESEVPTVKQTIEW